MSDSVYSRDIQLQFSVWRQEKVSHRVQPVNHQKISLKGFQNAFGIPYPKTPSRTWTKVDPQKYAGGNLFQKFDSTHSNAKSCVVRIGVFVFRAVVQIRREKEKKKKIPTFQTFIKDNLLKVHKNEHIYQNNMWADR